MALAKLMLQPFNVLVMDEPTNHLDIKSKNVLKDALKRFEGTLILVSHDRDFLQGLTNVVYEFKDHKIREYLGDVDFYLEQREITNLRDVEKTDKKAIKKEEPKEAKSYDVQRKQKSLSNRLSKVESQIASLEREIKAIDAKLQQDYDATVAQVNFFDKYQSKKKQLPLLRLKTS